MNRLSWTSETSMLHNDALDEDIEYTECTSKYRLNYSDVTIVSIEFTVARMAKVIGFELFSASWSTRGTSVAIPLPRTCVTLKQAMDACEQVLCDILDAVKLDIEQQSMGKDDSSDLDLLRCPLGFSGCISAPEYIKMNYPEWYAELGSPTTCSAYNLRQCIEGERYDNEDK